MVNGNRTYGSFQNVGYTPHIIEADRIFFDNEDMLYLILISEASWI